MSSYLIHAVEPLARVPQERPDNPQNWTPEGASTKRVDPYKDVVEFDNAYATPISDLLRDKEPRGAYDYLRLTAFNDPLIQVDGYALIYSWLHNELSITDVQANQGWIRRRVGDVLHILKPDNKEAFHILMEELDTKISAWFSYRVQSSSYRHMKLGFAIPQTYLEFPSKVPSNSPLFKKLQTILEESAPQEPPLAIES